MDWSRVVLALLFVIAGTLHFVFPSAYARIVPPMLPSPLLLVYVSGACEIAGGVGLLFASTREAAAWALAVLLVAVLPANVYMAWAHVQLAGAMVPSWALWARVPLQLPLVWWVLRSR